MSEKHCIDFDGNKVVAGDKVKVYGLIGCKDYIGEFTVWTVGDMNEKQTNMPYIKGKGAWSSKAIRKING